MEEKHLDKTGLEYFWSKLKAKLAGKQDKLAGTAGQVVGFDADGLPAAQEKPAYTAGEVGAATPEYVDTSIQTAIQSAWEGSY